MSLQSDGSHRTSIRRRTRTIRFDLSQHDNDNDDTLFIPHHLTDEERKAMWWNKSEIHQMRKRAIEDSRMSHCQAHAFTASRFFSFDDSSPFSFSVESIRLIIDRSTIIDESDNMEILLNKAVARRLESIEKQQQQRKNRDHRCTNNNNNNNKRQRRMYGVRRVVQVQKFLNHQQQQHEAPSRKAELLRNASLYHSESHSLLAQLIGEVDKLVASNAYQKEEN